MSLLSGIRDPRDLSDRLHEARKLTAEMLSDVVQEVCWRFASLRRAGKVARVERLIKSEAWTDAALALIDLELPHWQVRRIVYDEGEWYCALSRQREVPDWLDQSIESRHADLPLAILLALLEARRTGVPTVRTSVPGVALVTDALDEPVGCDHFS